MELLRSWSSFTFELFVEVLVETAKSTFSTYSIVFMWIYCRVGSLGTWEEVHNLYWKIHCAWIKRKCILLLNLPVNNKIIWFIFFLLLYLPFFFQLKSIDGYVLSWIVFFLNFNSISLRFPDLTCILIISSATDYELIISLWLVHRNEPTVLNSPYYQADCFFYC